MHNVFVSFHHKNDQNEKDHIVRMGTEYGIFRDYSVGDYEIDESLSDDAIARIIRDKYLRYSTVTIVLVGAETRDRKHCDWEIKSSLYNGPINKKSGLVVILLPSSQGYLGHTAHVSEKSLYPGSQFVSIKTRTDYERMYPDMPARIIDNLVKGTSSFSVTPWEKVVNSPATLKLLIDNAFNAREDNEYCLSRPMRRANYVRNALSAF